MGAINAMQKLDLVQADKCNNTTQSEVATAFKDLYKFLDTHISAHHKIHMVFDPITIEHALCKYSKLHPQPRKKGKKGKKTNKKEGVKKRYSKTGKQRT